MVVVIYSLLTELPLWLVSSRKFSITSTLSSSTHIYKCVYAHFNDEKSVTSLWVYLHSRLTSQFSVSLRFMYYLCIHVVFAWARDHTSRRVSVNWFCCRRECVLFLTSCNSVHIRSHHCRAWAPWAQWQLDKNEIYMTREKMKMTKQKREREYVSQVHALWWCWNLLL